MVFTDRIGLGGSVAGTVFRRLVGPCGIDDLGEIGNMTSYAAACSVAAAYGGDQSLIPAAVGFLYGNAKAPSGLSPISGRDMTWEDLSREVAGIGGANLMIVPFSSPPTLSSVEPGSGQGTYNGGKNAVTFHAMTRSGDQSVNAFSGSGYADPLSHSHFMYHVLLLTGELGGCHGGGSRNILARASLSRTGEEFRSKPDGYELAVDWRVAFF